MAKRKKKGVDEKMEDLNLVPIMNLVVCLIPIVLFGMSLQKLASLTSIHLSLVWANQPQLKMTKSRSG